ncbi:hypothetical protein BDF20DRAFT_838286 [Mycotypha africana]|uniref:uncharacterized protein n=1 Tax=Mycotypha africana TaxID=64632 RepID=UPI002300A3C6|nr:uncharacterized protein BDF20DRAFT_838286 [Mycotypha africana]KAI8972021.1 hypothetical protein BDF20DRAFT_838286 [Mycotypha africana]
MLAAGSLRMNILDQLFNLILRRGEGLDYLKKKNNNTRINISIEIIELYLTKRGYKFPAILSRTELHRTILMRGEVLIKRKNLLDVDTPFPRISEACNMFVLLCKVELCDIPFFYRRHLPGTAGRMFLDRIYDHRFTYLLSDESTLSKISIVMQLFVIIRKCDSMAAKSVYIIASDNRTGVGRLTSSHGVVLEQSATYNFIIIYSKDGSKIFQVVYIQH